MHGLLVLLMACSGDEAKEPPASTTTSSPEPSTDDTPTTSTPPGETGETGEGTIPFAPLAAGPHDVTSTYSEAGPRPVKVFRPTGVADGTVVVFLHGFQLDPTLYESTADHLASWGHTVVLPAMSGTLFVPTTHADLAVEMSSVLDWIETDPPLLDGTSPSTLVLSGHSLGGKIAALLATEDERIDALFLIDPVDAGPPIFNNPVDYPSVTPELMNQITVPTVIVGESVNTTGFQPCAPEEDNFQAYADHATSPTLAFEFVTANHMSWLDNPDCGITCAACPDGTDDPATTRALTQAAMVAFLQGEFAADPDGFAWLLGTLASQPDVTLTTQTNETHWSDSRHADGL